MTSISAAALTANANLNINGHTDAAVNLGNNVDGKGNNYNTLFKKLLNRIITNINLAVSTVGGNIEDTAADDLDAVARSLVNQHSTAERHGPYESKL